MHLQLTAWDRAALAAHTDDVLAVYAEAMEVPLSTALSRRGILLSHLEREGLRGIAAQEDARLVGFAYGYVGRPGQWWHDQVRVALGPDLARTWLAHAFEVCELHVLPSHQGLSIGRSLLDDLLAGADAATSVLTTPDHETRARAFYRAHGWVDLVTGLRFPGDQRVFAVLGKDL